MAIAGKLHNHSDARLNAEFDQIYKVIQNINIPPENLQLDPLYKKIDSHFKLGDRLLREAIYADSYITFRFREATLASGLATVESTFVRLAPETGVADDCDKLFDTRDGLDNDSATLLFVMAKTGTITMKHDGVFLKLNGSDVALTGTDVMMLFGHGSQWTMIAHTGT